MGYIQWGNYMTRYKELTEIGYPGYRVSDDGLVWTRWKKQHLGSIGTKRYQSKEWRRVVGCIDKDGYVIVSVKNDQCKLKDMRAHRLVLLAFVGECPDGMVCRHLDGNPSNNALSNLRWGTQKENSLDKERHGRGNKGEKHGNALLSEEQVREIKRLGKTVSQPQLAKMFSVSKGCIHDIVKNINWKHVVV